MLKTILVIAVVILVLCVLVAWLAAPVLARGTRLEEIGQQVDLIELNETRLSPDNPEAVLHQLIFWEWSAEYGRYNVRSWVFVVPDDLLRMTPIKHAGVYRVVVREFGLVTSRNFRRTVTQKDPERENRLVFPEEFRMPLASPTFIRKQRPPCW